MTLSPIQAPATAAFGAALLIAPAANAETRTYSADHKSSNFRDGGRVTNFNKAAFCEVAPADHLWGLG